MADPRWVPLRLHGLEADPAAQVGGILWLGCAFLVGLLALVWVGMLLGIPMRWFHLPLAVVVVVALTLARRHNVPLRAGLTHLACAMVMLGLCTITQSWLFDPSYDGLAYHQVATIAFVQGWNPHRVPHVADWFRTAFPELSWVEETLADGGLWTDHYPKASWVLGAAMASATGSLNAAKWPQGFVAFLGLVALLRGLLLVGVPHWFAMLGGATAALSPVVVAQMGSFYVDGLLGSALLVMAGGGVAWVCTRSCGDLFVFASGSILAVNLKFTGVVYGALALLFLLAIVVGQRRGLSRGEWGVAALMSVLGAFISVQPYLHNLLAHGSPVHPLEVVDVIRSQMSAAFLDQPREVKLWRALFNEPFIEAGERGTGHEATLLAPRLWHYYRVMQYLDARLAGFGTLFGYSLIAAIVMAAACVIAPHVLTSPAPIWRRGSVLVILGLGAWVVGSTVVHPEMWWARYVPQLWWLPVLAAVVIWLSGRRWLAAATLAPATLGALLSLVYWTELTVRMQAGHSQFMAQAQAHGAVVLRRGERNDHAVFAVYHHMQAVQVRVRLGEVTVPCGLRLGPAGMACIGLD